MRELHAINDKGNLVTMPWEKLRKINEDNSNQDKYTHDVDWYLNNGYSLIDNMINEFETLFPSINWTDEQIANYAYNKNHISERYVHKLI